MTVVKFEKWQALGNDYLLLEAAELPWELTPGRVRCLCDRHLGVGADGVLLLSEPRGPGFVAWLRVFNPDGSEAELSGNGARQAIMYLRRNGWTDADTFSIETAAGEIRPTITGETTCTVDMGRAKLRSADYPAGGDLGRGELDVDGRRWGFQHVSIGNPQCVIFVDPDEIENLDLAVIGPPIEGNELFPNRTNVSFVCELEPGTIRARIFERGVGETLSSGTGACGAAVAYIQLRGAEPDVTVRLDGGELEVEVGEDLHVNLSGWAVPVFRGELTAELLEELNAAE
jgi:diaminopimelate epimerase